MNLSEKTIKSLQELVESYSMKNKRAGLNFLRNTVDILNKDEIFSGYITYQFDNSDCAFETSNEYIDSDIIYVCPDLIKSDLERVISESIGKVSEKYKLDVYNQYYLWALLHEANHIKQSLYAYYNISPYKEINTLYKEYVRRSNNLSAYRLNLYEKYASSYAFERSANIDTYETIINIYASNKYLKKIGELNYIYSIVDGYETKHNKFLSPAEKTLKLLGSSKKIKKCDLPFDVLLKEGLPIKEDLYDEIISLIEDKKNKKVTFEEIDDKIKKLCIKSR